MYVYSEHNKNAQNDGNGSAFKQLLEALLLARYKVVHWLHHRTELKYIYIIKQMMMKK